MSLDITVLGIDERYLAHTPDETLIAHSHLTREYLEKITTAKNLTPLIDDLLLRIDAVHVHLLKELFVNTIYLHDTGKTNPYFQAKKMNNPLFAQYKNQTHSSDHSFASSDHFIAYYLPKIATLHDRLSREKCKFILYAFSYHQAKHHGALGEFEAYRKMESDPKAYWNYVTKFGIPPFEFYILNKLLFSLVVSCDYYATTEYMAKLPTNDFGLFSKGDKEQLTLKFTQYSQKFKNPTGINQLRNEMFKEAERNLLENLDKPIFYLEAPTGSGKTITSINLALTLLEHDPHLRKLFYVFPFNTLVEQTKNVFEDIFGDALKVEVINAITPITVEEKSQEEEESLYQKSYMNRLFFHSPAIITTHVALFNILFGTSKEDNFPLWQLSNSVIILDEIQSYNNQLWWYMVEFFEKYATLLNMKIIIMSATLPKLDFFVDTKNNFVDLIPPQRRNDFFENTLFKNRVAIDFSLLNETMSFERLGEILACQPKAKKILFEFIKKQSAREFYNRIKEDFDNVYELSGDDNKAYRQYVINESKKDHPLILVATQVIEAGVDIDMDIGFKDISTLDGEEQFMGRINRSCLREGKVYFFNMDDVAKIYTNDHRLGLDLKDKKYQTILENKNFGDYYHEVLAQIKKSGDKYQNGTMTNHENFSALLTKLNYKAISKTMTLINSQNFTLYFPFQIDVSIYEGVKEFVALEEVFLTKGHLDGQKVWDTFKDLTTIQGYAKKQIYASKINALMQFFTFNLVKFNDKQTLPYYSYAYGGYYFIANYEDFICEGKFDRAAYLAKKEELFL